MRLKPSLILLMFPIASHALGLPDSGQALCDNGLNQLQTCSSSNTADTANFPRQDGRFGLDPQSLALTGNKVGGGMVGFDYTKIANDGSVLNAAALLGSGPSNWACTRDNVTGLTWEVKTSDAGLRDASWHYSWYSDVSSTNGGNSGSFSGGTCGAAVSCSTQSYVANVNAAFLCGNFDWRVPSLRELQSLVHAGRHTPSIDTDYFPNTVSDAYWSDTTWATSPAQARGVSFNQGVSFVNLKSTRNYLRLVRGGSF